VTDVTRAEELAGMSVKELLLITEYPNNSEIQELARRVADAEALAEALERLRNAPVTVAPGKDYPLEQWRADVEVAEQALARHRGEKS
jgi:hypothetical protein